MGKRNEFDKYEGLDNNLKQQKKDYEERNEDHEEPTSEDGDQKAPDSSVGYNEQSIPPTATRQLPRTPLTATGEASKSSEDELFSSVSKGRLEEISNQLREEKLETTRLSDKIWELEKKHQPAQVAESNDKASSISSFSPDSLNCMLDDRFELQEQLRASQDRIRTQQKANFTTVDSLIDAFGKQSKGSIAAESLSLMDRINYLNLVCFFRTRNYLQLALREQDDRLAKILLNDAINWVKFCQEDFAKMDPSVNLQIQASMGILHGVKKALTATDRESMTKGIKHVNDGRKELAKFSNNESFAQLVQLADSIIKTTKEYGEENNLDGKRLRFDLFSLRSKFRRNKIQETIKDDPTMKSKMLRLPGVHSPLSPEKWSKVNRGEDSELDENNE
ncbi:hypothetical protein IL306_002615 [Fusarium sp. DS 682]|nr:hypothetical protein IL306_002615 [Fusarium sp. DS 682]